MRDLSKYLGASFECEECGRLHQVSLDRSLCAEDALEQLPACCAAATAGRRVQIIADDRTIQVAGETCLEVLKDAGFQVSVLLVEDSENGDFPICDDITHAWVEERLPETDVLVAIGSGVVSDLTKWTASDHDLPYVTVATAVSMNGYSSDNIAPAINGVKTLLHGKGPQAVLATPSILSGAPYEMTAAGLGDVLAKSVSGTDWRVNQILFDDYYCPLCAGLIDDIEHLYRDHPRAIANGETGAIKALFDALIYTGIAMSMAGTSSPASGGEHLISHTLDMMSGLDGVPHDFHGRQVGIGTIFSAALYRELLTLDDPDFRLPETEFDAAFWGRFSGEVETHYAKKQVRLTDAVRELHSSPEKWDRIKEAIAVSAGRPETIKTCLRDAGAAHRIRDLGIDRDRFIAALLHAYQMRERFTVLDLAACAGIQPTRFVEIADEWLVE